MKYAKVLVTNILKDTNTDIGYGIKLHHVVCDCTIEGGQTEKQAYRIFSKREYESVMSNGYYEIPDSDSILEDVKKQINGTIDQHPHLSVNDVKVYLEDEFICFQVGEFSHKEKVVDFLTAYINGTEIDDTGAIALNTETLLYEMDDIMKISTKKDLYSRS